ncbi:hypothetical protein FGF1_19950 [Flavobacteriaceae bacterium GF1]
MKEPFKLRPRAMGHFTKWAWAKLGPLALFLISINIPQQLEGQTISGQTRVIEGVTYTYYLNHTGTINTTSWITPSGSTISSSGNQSIRLSFGSSGTVFLRAGFSSGGTYEFAGLRITVAPGLNAGNIYGTQTICYNGNANTLGSTSLASNGTGTYSYQWQYSSNGSSGWLNISGATGTTYTPPGGRTATRWYRRRVVSGIQTKYTAPVRVLVRPPLTAGSITGTQTVCYGGDPSTLGNGALPSNGIGRYTYQWQISSNNSTWSNISSATGSTYNPPSGQVSTRWFRRRVISCGQTKYTPSVKVTVLPALSAGRVTGTQTVCYGGNPSNLVNRASPANGLGGYTYQWQLSSNNSSWGNISGATGSSYNPPSGQTATRWYRRRVISCGQTKYSASVKVTVLPALSAGSINGTQTVCYGGDPFTLGNAASPSNWYSRYAHQWQISSNNSSWSNISGATASTYNPPSGQTATRWYRRGVMACGQTTYTPSIKVTVRSDLSPGSINGTQTVCYGGDPSTLGNSTSPSGGNGSYAHQWQLSSNNSSWSNISGATASTYNPPSGQTATRWYRRRVISCERTKYTGSIKVTVRPAVSTPTLASKVNNCGSTVLTMGTAPSGETWYWQGSPGGTSTSNSTSAVTRTGGTVYYLRAKSNSDSCWGTALTINYTINTGAVWYADTDGDGFGDPTNSTQACSRPTGYVENGDDRNVSVAGSHFGTTGPAPGSGTYTPVIKSDENYVHVRTYQNPLKESDPIGLNRDVIEGITYFDGLGRGKQQVAIKASGREPQNFDYTSNVPGWSMDWTPGSGGTPFFNQNGSIVENQRINGSNPHGAISLLWECGNEADNHADGGWNTDYFAVDKNAAYRYTVWVKRTHSQDGLTYHGTQNVNNLNGSANGNPYFWYGDLPELDTWYLLVGIVHPAGHSGGDSGVSGVYDLRGNKVIDGTEYAWRSTTTTARFRSYLYYATDVGVRQYFHQPVLQKLDGTEDALGDIIAGTMYSGELKDLVTHMGYDTYGRQAREWLPYSAASGSLGSFRGTAETDTDSYYIGKYSGEINSVTPNPFSERAFEASPLDRVLKQAAPGYDWRMGGGHEVEFGYAANATNEVRKYKVTTTVANNTYTPSLVADGHYTAGTLYKTITYDENQASTSKLHSTEEFTDKQGRVVLKRTYALVGSTETAHDTYYVYDDFGNLTYTLPPKVVAGDGVSATELNELCYQYVYDHRNRLVEKKVPGKGWEHIVYNKLDRPILTRDPNLKAQGQWLFTKYDAHGRVAYTGLVSSTGSRSTHQTAADQVATPYESPSATATKFESNTVSVHYGNDAYPKTNISKIHTVNYYDSYVDTDGLSVPTTVLGQAMASNVKGLATVNKVRVLDPSATAGQADWITTLTGYDAKGRPIYTASKNTYLGTTDVVETQLDFGGKVVRTKTSHTKGTNAALVTTDDFSYDHRGRLLKQQQTIGSHTETIVENAYDDLGQLARKKVGGGSTASPTALQNVDYRYNVRGWLTKINDPANLGTDLFGFKINYNTVAHSGTKLYNGNIAETEWRTANTDNSLKWYRYGYDALNRLTSATANSSNYSVSGISYDKMGNILALTRKGHTNGGATSFGTMDHLVYTYDSGNKLTKVLDNGNDTYGFRDGTTNGQDYWYDANGNMVRDLNKGIGTTSVDGIGHNHLNLPTEVKFDNSSTKKITYIYDALGTKLKKMTYNNGVSTTTDYAGNYIYENNALQFFTHPEGYVMPNTSGGYDYVYQYRDHLGNVRLAYKDNALTNDNFETGLDGWHGQSASVVLENGRLKVTVDDRWNAAQKYVNVSIGDVIEYRLELDKGTTEKLVLVMYEHDSNYVRLKGALASTDASGLVTGSYTVTAGTKLRLKVEKGLASDNGTDTYFYLDNVYVTKGDVEILEENNYYPFGLQHKGYNSNVSSLGNSVAQRWKFGGKEYQEELGLNWYDITARNYDPALGRWMNLDPLAEQMRRHSLYNFAFDNPIYFQDYDGMAPTGCCFPSDIGEGIARSFREKINKTSKFVEKTFKQVATLAAGNAMMTLKGAENVLNKLSGEGGGGYDFYSKTGGGEETRKGDMKTELINGDAIMSAVPLGPTASAPLNKGKVLDTDPIATVVAGIDKGAAATEAVKEVSSGSLGSSNNNEPSSGNEPVSVQLHTKNPDFGYVDGQLMDAGRTTFRDTTVTVSTADSIVRSNDSIQLEKVREARRNFLNRNN